MNRPTWLTTLLAALLLVSVAGAATITIMNTQVLRFDAPAATPAVSSVGTARMYFRADAGQLLASVNGGAYQALGGNSLPSITEHDGGVWLAPNIAGNAYVNSNAILTTATGDNTKVAKAGDTMTGTLIVNKTAQASTGEMMADFTVSDDTGAGCQFINGSTTDAQGQPFLWCFQDTTNAASTAWRGGTTAALDTGTTPVMLWQAGRAVSKAAGLNAALTTRPIMGVYNYGTEVDELSATGAHSNPSTNVCSTFTGTNGLYCVNDPDGFAVHTGTTGFTFAGGNFQVYNDSNVYTPFFLLASSITLRPSSGNYVSVDAALGFKSLLYSTASNCSSSAAPAVCAAAPAGSVVVAAAGTTVTVNTTAVTANSQIMLTRDDSLGTKLGVTCNTATVAGDIKVSARTAATSFTITVQNAPVTNPLCLSYSILN